MKQIRVVSNMEVDVNNAILDVRKPVTLNFDWGAGGKVTVVNNSMDAVTITGRDTINDEETYTVLFGDTVSFEYDGKYYVSPESLYSTSKAKNSASEFIERGVNVVEVYGALGDGFYHSIKDVFPDVTLAEAQALNASATLSSTANWYAIQKAISENDNVFIPSGDYWTDLPLVIDNVQTIQGVSRKTYIYNHGIGVNAIEANNKLTLKSIIVEGKATTGHGLVISTSFIDTYDCSFNGNGGYGIEYDETGPAAFSNITRAVIYGNVLGGIHCATNVSFQKTAIHIDRCYVVNNGGMTDPDVAQTSGGFGIFLGAPLGQTVTRTVSERNHGAGIEIAEVGLYGVYGAEITGCYLEGNRLANIYVNNADNTRAYKDIHISGNYYTAYPGVGPTYYTNSLLPQSERVVVKDHDSITESIIDGRHYGFYLPKEKTIATETETGEKGEIHWDSNYLYICIATDTWRRIAVPATW